VQLIAALVDTGDLHAFTGDDLAAVGLLLVGQHAEQGGLARAVAADDADDGSLGNGQRQIIDQYPIAIALGNAVQFDDLIPQALAGRDVDLVGFAALLEFLGLHFLEALQAGLGLGLATFCALAHPLQLGLHGLGVGGFLLGLGGQAVGLGFQPLGVVA